MRKIRDYIVASDLSFVMPEEEFRRSNFGATRIEVAERLLRERVGLDVEGIATIQVVTCGELTTIWCRAV